MDYGLTTIIKMCAEIKRMKLTDSVITNEKVFIFSFRIQSVINQLIVMS